MSLEQAIDTESIKEKFRNLREYLPNQAETVYEFGRFLADRLNPKLNPVGFVITVRCALADLRRGINGFSGKPISGKLVGYPLEVYAGLDLIIPELAEAVCPPEFARGVKESYEQIERLVQQTV